MAPIKMPKGKNLTFCHFRLSPIEFNVLPSVLYNNHVAINKKILDPKGKYFFRKGLSTSPLKINADPKRIIAKIYLDVTG
mgnify:CR=1 FL=1